MAVWDNCEIWYSYNIGNLQFATIVTGLPMLTKTETQYSEVALAANLHFFFKDKNEVRVTAV